MEILFKNKKLRAEFESERKLRGGKYSKFAPKIMQRLDDFVAFETLDDLQREMPHIHCHEMTGKMKGLLAVDISGNYRLLFRPEEPPPLKSDGGLDWKQIKTIVIVAIEDYH